MHYQTQFDVAAGQYRLKVVFNSGGQSFGKLESPLNIDPYDNSKFGISSIALSRELHKVSDLDVSLDAALLEDHTPLVSMGMELVPYGSNTFGKAGPAAAYLEVYEPLLQQQQGGDFKVWRRHAPGGQEDRTAETRYGICHACAVHQGRQPDDSCRLAIAY